MNMYSNTTEGVSEGENELQLSEGDGIGRNENDEDKEEDQNKGQGGLCKQINDKSNQWEIKGRIESQQEEKDADIIG
ncbi:MAG: hypothetical protein EZS28_000666 [Streblomastix strix]|uniref:Uncharacterized protein n=1 Tax=Streblomastix strix TaxID=222440 RepID=A0A5J4X9J6_9EUKA|nr:MAG: hypothetical protein EZS28_000666 [Streblomastix strix]